MRYRLRFAAVIAAVIFAASCTQSQTPTSPSRVSSLGQSPASASALSSWAAQSQRGTVADWACFTTGVGCPILPIPENVFGQDPPAAPSNLAFQVSGTTVILTWSPPGPGPEVSRYVVEAGTGPGLSNIARFDTGNIATTLTVTSVPAGTYVVRVRAANVAGPDGSCGSGTPGPTPNTCVGAASNEVTIVVTTGPCPPPAAPTGLFQSVSGNTVMLSWNAFTGAISYIIEAGSSSGASNIVIFDTGSAATSFSGNAPPGTYFIRIRVRTACGTSGVSNEVIATVSGGGNVPNVAGQWTGLAPDGLVAPDSPCDKAWDMFLSITQNGTALSGTATFRVRETVCGSPGETATLPLENATVSSSGTISFTNRFPEGSWTMTGTVTATRMSGAVTVRGPDGRVRGSGTWAVNR